MSKYHNAFQGFVKAFTGAAKPGVKGNPTTIIGIAPSKNIKKFTEQKEKILKTTDKYKSAVNDPEVKKKMSSGVSKTLSDISKIYKGEPITKKVKKVEKKAKGGRIGLKGGGNDMGSTTNKSINSLKNILENRKKSKISSEQEEQKNMALQRVKDRPYNPEDDFDTYKKRTKAMGGNVYTAAEMKSKGGRIGRKMGGGSDMGNTNVKKKHKGFSKLPETVQIKINKKLAKKV